MVSNHSVGKEHGELNLSDVEPCSQSVNARRQRVVIHPIEAVVSVVVRVFDFVASILDVALGPKSDRRRSRRKANPLK